MQYAGIVENIKVFEAIGAISDVDTNPGVRLRSDQ